METAAERAQVEENQRRSQGAESTRDSLLKDLSASAIEPIEIYIENYPNARIISVNQLLHGSHGDQFINLLSTLRVEGFITPENEEAILAMSLSKFLAEMEEVKRRLDGVYDVTDIGQLDEQDNEATTIPVVQAEQRQVTATALRGEDDLITPRRPLWPKEDEA